MYIIGDNMFKDNDILTFFYLFTFNPSF